MSQVAHTPGPWKWQRRGKEFSLIHPGHGWLTVMDFARLGMQGGTFRLATWKGDERQNMGGIMVPAHEIEVSNHPDARLIAAAPELLAACQRFLDAHAVLTPAHSMTGDHKLCRCGPCDDAREAITKAKGGAT